MRISELFCSSAMRTKLEQLYGHQDISRTVENYSKEKKKRFLLCMAITVLFSISVFVIEYRESAVQIDSVSRNTYGGGSKKVDIIADFEAGSRQETMSISVSEKKYSTEQLRAFSDSLEENIWDIVRGNNPSLEEVSENLNLVTHIDGYPFSISWKSDRPALVNSSGVINKDKLNELTKEQGNSVPVQLCATLSYGNYSEEIYGFVAVVRSSRKDYQTFLEDVNRTIDEYDIRSQTSDKQLLPESVDGIDITYRQKRKNNAVLVIVIGIICSFGLMFAKDKDIEKKLKEREEQMNRDYPRILNQYNLYYCAGMNHRMIWKQICDRYLNELQKKGTKKVAYEEMIITDRKINDGLGEICAYEDFANRCSNPKYRSFVNLIEQSVKKGQGQFSILLSEEVDKALREENNRIRMEAAELSTKLLGPMIIMLVIVLVIVLFPAFVSFK